MYTRCPHCEAGFRGDTIPAHKFMGARCPGSPAAPSDVQVHNVDHIDYDAKGDARTFSGPGAVDVFAMAVIASGLRLYAKTGIKPNRMYTPRNMMAAATRHTGRTFKARDYIGAAEALEAKVQIEKARIAAAQGPKS